MRAEPPVEREPRRELFVAAERDVANGRVQQSIEADHLDFLAGSHRDAEVAPVAIPAPKPTIGLTAQPKIAMASAERFGRNIPFQIRKPKEAVPTTAAEAVEQAYAQPEQAPAVDAFKTASVPSGWAVQVASSPSDAEARSILEKTAKQAPRVLADASAYTVPFEKGGVTYFRARFAGFETKDAAWKACNALKKQKVSCYAIEQ